MATVNDHRMLSGILSGQEDSHVVLIQGLSYKGVCNFYLFVLHLTDSFKVNGVHLLKWSLKSSK